jgi:acetyl-CoA carboxylase biotin carboxylase subunit
MFRKILIANRGEIALRIIRTCKEMDIETVAVYSTADAEALHTKLATQAVCIGSERSADSYLNMNAIISAAEATHCDAIHPGYGFLSENADFADLCKKNGITFIGPSGDIIRKLGDKSAARSLMMQAGVPIVPGSDGALKNADEGEALAAKIGYPVLIKASAGGGGRGMRRVFHPEDFKTLYEEARSEAAACFGNGELYLEKLVLEPKHIEFQILADSRGNVVHLGERDCSIQRRNQKLIEESPSKALSQELRSRMGEAAVKAAKAGGYESAGTVEFVLGKDNEFYFIEMNTRIQVEHPVTEMITGIDIVREQIRIAAGLTLETKQSDINFSGHAIECRINAEDPDNGFRPSPGRINFLHLPGGHGVRVDTALYNNCEISPYYDSLAAKIITVGKTRLEAIRIMRRALEELMIGGITTNESLSYLILHDPEFMKGEYDTGFMDRKLDTFVTWNRLYDEILDREN